MHNKGWGCPNRACFQVNTVGLPLQDLMNLAPPQRKESLVIGSKNTSRMLQVKDLCRTSNSPRFSITENLGELLYHAICSTAYQNVT